jgi:eukaryotic-like serine/threonine-protein kinase
MASTRTEYHELLRGTPYRAIAHLGSGGMGEIYEAIDPARGERVVVKVLRPELASQRDFRDRMRLEGETLKLLSHPHIVAGRGHGVTADQLPYVAMERLHGATLREELSRRGGPLAAVDAIRHTRQLLSALGAVHHAGLVHRDVKPDNVMVCAARAGTAASAASGRRETRIKLLDFGIAKVKAGHRAGVSPLAFPTREGLCVGTPRYISPEQASGAELDPRSDLYAAGLLLYALVAGRGPFDEIKGAASLLRAHQDVPPPPPSRVASVSIPAALEAVILRAIAKSPIDRFADASSFHRALGLTLAEIHEVPRPILRHLDIQTDPTVRSPKADMKATLVAVPLRSPVRAIHSPVLPLAPTALLARCVRHRSLRCLARRFLGAALIFGAAALGAVIGALAMWLTE